MTGNVFLKRGLLLLIALLAVLAVMVTPAFAASLVWQPVGSPDFSAGAATSESLFVYDGTPYVAYLDETNSGKATVMEYTGVSATNPTGWTSVGSPGFSDSYVEYLSFYVDNGTPYVAYEDQNNDHKATVMEYTDTGATGWTTVGGAPASSSDALDESLYVDNGTPYVAYSDGTNGIYGATVMEYTGLTNGWQPVGSANFTGSQASSESLFFYEGTPYLAYQDYSGDTPKYGATVMEYTGLTNGWQPVGNTDFSSGEADDIHLYIDNGTPYVSYVDLVNSYKATVMECTGNLWTEVGSAVSAGEADYPSLFVYGGTPYVAYADGEDGPATVMEYSGLTNGWQPVGSSDFSNTRANYESLFVYEGTPYVAYQDGEGEEEGIVISSKTDVDLVPGSGQATVMEAVPPIVVPTLSFSPVSGSSIYTTTPITIIPSSELSTDEAVYYTTDGTTPPTTLSNWYKASFTLSVSGTVYAAVYDSTAGWGSQASATYTITTPTTGGGGAHIPTLSFSPSSGPIATSTLIHINPSSTLSTYESIYYTTNGTNLTTTGSDWYTAPFPLTVAATVYAAVYDSIAGWGSPASATYTIATTSSGGGGGPPVYYTPSVQTDAATSVTATSAVLNGDITSDNGYDVTAYGFLWGTSSTSLTNTLAVGTNNQSGAFTDTLSSLTDGTTYYFEAYATNSQGTADGAVLSFTAGAQTTTTTPTTPTTPPTQVFPDVLPSYWAYGDIENLNSLGYVSGYPDGTFKPGNQITRAEFATIMDKLLNLTTYTQQTPTFTDVNQTDWFDRAVEESVYAGIFKGYGDGTFHPNAPISRQEIACVLVQALGKSQLADSNAQAVTKFLDDQSIAWWSRGYIFVALQQGIVNGYPDNTYKPGNETIRAEACAMVENFLSAYK